MTIPGLPTSAELKPLVDDVLDRFLVAEADGLPLGDERRLMDEVIRVVRAGGKRLRPSFCYWGYRAAGGDRSAEILRVAASLELLHTFAIVHDDVMDASPLRRGEPTVQRRFAEEDRVPALVDAAARFGDSAAVLVGDLAFVLADDLFFGSGFDWESLGRGAKWFAAMRREVIRGQFLDLVAAFEGGATPEQARRIAALKSGGYTVEKPLLIGGALGGAADDVLDRLSAYGQPLGEAFQLRDDVLGTFGEPDETGKDADGDLLEGKQTFLVAIARDRAVESERRFLDSSLGRRDLSQEHVAKLRELLVKTGALEATNALIEELTSRAIDVAETFPGDVGEALVALALDASVRRV